MNIQQALYQKLTESTIVDSYYGKIMVKGYQKTYIPVDFRLKKGKVSIPFKDDDIYFQYKLKTESSNVCRGEYVLTKYYPIGTTLTIGDMVLQVTSYGEPVAIAGSIRVPIFTKCLNQDESNLIEVITNRSVEDKVKKEMESILISNDIIKRTLPYYKYDWLNYTEENISTYDEYISLKKLFNIKFMETSEYEYKLNDMNTIFTVENFDELSTDYKAFIKRMNFEKMPVKYNRASIIFNLISIAKWILFNREFKHGNLYLQNSYKDLCELQVRRGNNKSIIINIKTPQYSFYDYKIELSNVVKCNMYGVYYEYVMDNIRIFKVTKGCCGTETEIASLTTTTSTDTTDNKLKPAPLLCCPYPAWTCINDCPPSNCNHREAGDDPHNHHCHSDGCNCTCDDDEILVTTSEDSDAINEDKFNDTFFMIFVEILRHICASAQCVTESGADCKDEYYGLLENILINLINQYKSEADDEDTYCNTAEEFKERYLNILSLTTESVTSEDRDTINAAIDDYDHLSEEEKSKLVDERLKLTALLDALDYEEIKNKGANGIVIDEEGLSLTYNGVKIGTTIPINVISEMIVEESNQGVASGIVTSVEF